MRYLAILITFLIVVYSEEAALKNNKRTSMPLKKQIEMNFTFLEQRRTIILYEWRCGTNASTTAKNIKGAFNQRVVSH